jgi:structural maintenance of chromosome 4
LVKVGNDDLMTAFYAELRNTLVADNLEQASRIAYGQQRNRVVTLKGELIEVTGTMSGGGRPQKGRMGTKVVEELSVDVIKQMESTLKNDENEIRDLINRKQLIEPKIYELKTKLEKNKNDLLKWKQEIISIKEQINALKKGEIECKKKLKEVVLDENEKKKLQNNLDKYKQEYDKAESIALKVRQDCEELHENIMSTNKKILEKPKKNLENLDNEIKEMKNQVTSLNVEIKSSTRLISNSKKKISSLNEDFELNEVKAQKCQKRLQEMDIEGKKLIEEHEIVKKELEELQEEINEKTKLNKEAEKEKQKYEKSKIDLAHKLDKLMQGLNSDDRELKHLKHLLESLKLHEVNMERLRLKFINKQQDDSIDVASEEKLLKYNDEELDDMDIDGLNEEIEENEERLKTMNPNTAAIQNYLELEEKFRARMNELEEVEKKRSELEAKYDELKKKRLEEFMAGFITIKTKLKEIYRTITFEGDAELELVDTLNPFTEGVVLSIRPPKKSWKNISNLSGGEKTLSSLSLVFALHEYRATPIYVMDEIDAALDFKNVSIIAKYIKDRTKNAQFIIISLRNNMFELADRLFGIYKVNNCTSASYISPEICELEEKIQKRKEEDDKQNSTIIATQNENLISS